MAENIKKFEGDLKRRSVVKAAAWAAPVVAVAVAAPVHATSHEEPVEATSIGVDATSPRVNGNGRIRPYGIDADLNDAYFPDSQTFTLTSSDLDFNAIVTSITGGVITPSGSGVWLIIPNSGATSVDIRFNSPTVGSYTVTSNGPVLPSGSWNGAVLS